MNAIQGIIKKEEYGFTSSQRIRSVGNYGRWNVFYLPSLDSCLHNMCRPTARSTCYLLFWPYVLNTNLHL